MLIGSLWDKAGENFPDISNQESTIIDYLIFMLIAVLKINILVGLEYDYFSHKLILTLGIADFKHDPIPI